MEKPVINGTLDAVIVGKDEDGIWVDLRIGENGIFILIGNNGKVDWQVIGKQSPYILQTGEEKVIIDE